MVKIARIVALAGFVTTAAAILIIGSAMQRSDSDTTQPEIEISYLGAQVPRQEPVYDEEGRRVVVVGEMSLHIPASRASASTTLSPENRVTQVWLCWPKQEDSGECPGIENVIFIYLQAGNKRPTIDDGMVKLRQELHSYDGPIESEMKGIWKFSTPVSDTIFHYAIVDPDPTGRHVVARCYGGPRCSSWISVFPGLAARYDFDKRHLPVWPAIDQQVRSDIKSFLIESDVD